MRFRLKFTPNSGGACTDVVKLTVVRVDLDAANLLDEDEETASGRLIAENDDFDENKGDPNVQREPDDADASPVHADGSAIVTDDLVPLSRVMLPGGDGMFSGATVTLTKAGGAGVVRVVAVNPAASAPYDNDWVEVPLGDNLRDDFFLSTGQYRLFDWYAEGVAPGDVTLELTFENGPIRALDRVVLTVVDVDVVELTFRGSDYYVVRKDDNSGDYGAPHWKDVNLDGDARDDSLGDQRYPAAYVRDHSMRIDAKLKVTPMTVFPGSVRVRGEGPGAYDFQADTTLSAGELTITDVQSSGQLVNEIDFMNPLVLDWRVSPDAGTIWLDAGPTDNTVYVTLASPAGERFESFFDISTKAADGESTPQGAFAKIWDDFSDCEVRNVRNERLGYYRTTLCASNCTIYTAQGLVTNTNGQCGAWADLLRRCASMHGITQTFFITIEPSGSTPADCAGNPNPKALGFIVREYGFASGNGTSGCNVYPYRFDDPCALYTPWPGGTVEVTDSPGIPGQDEINPASWFARYFIVLYGNKYYDPSYGNGPLSSQLMWEDAAINRSI